MGAILGSSAGRPSSGASIRTEDYMVPVISPGLMNHTAARLEDLRTRWALGAFDALPLCHTPVAPPCPCWRGYQWLPVLLHSSSPHIQERCRARSSSEMALPQSGHGISPAMPSSKRACALSRSLPGWKLDIISASSNHFEPRNREFGNLHSSNLNLETST